MLRGKLYCQGNRRRQVDVTGDKLYGRCLCMNCQAERGPYLDMTAV